MADATLVQLRQFIIARFNDEQLPMTGYGDGQLPGQPTNSTSGVPVSGAAFQRAKPVIDRIADSTVQRELIGHMGMCTKFQFLQMITEPNHPLMQKSPDIVLGITNAIIGEEYARDGSINGGLHKL